MISADFLKNIRGYKVLEKIKLKLSGNVIHLKTRQKKQGDVLLSYITLPFVIKESFMDAHTNRWECREIARIFLDKGYDVDLIDWTNVNFIPKKKYSYFLDIGTNLERLSETLGKSCIKILHLTGSFWDFHNKAEMKRIEFIHKRRGVCLMPRRQLPANKSIDFADYITLLGNEETKKTYLPHTNKPINLIPLSTTHLYSLPGNKNYESARNNFIWFGGSGLAHKGLDLALEAFAQMPEYNLTVCGKVSNEKDFANAYHKELYKTPNIRTVGLVDPGSATFKKILNESIAMVYPSSSEGQSGAVITTMHAGIIPILSRQSGVDVRDFGILLRENSIEEIKSQIRFTAELEGDELRRRSMDAWRFARENHTKKNFSFAYENFIEEILNV